MSDRVDAQPPQPAAGEATENQDTRPPSQPPKSPPSNHFALKALVVGLAAIMVLMMVAIIARIIWLATQDGDTPRPDQPIALQLPPAAKVIDVDLSDRHLAVRYATGMGPMMIDIYDSATGELIRRFQIDRPTTDDEAAR